MARATVVLLIMLFTSFLLQEAGYNSLITTLYSTFQHDASNNIFSKVLQYVTLVAPIVAIGFSLISTSPAYAAFGLFLVGLALFPYDILTMAPQNIQFVVGGFYSVLTITATLSALRGDI